MQEKLEVELITHGKRGDRAAITELFGRYYPSSLRLARGILRSEEDSQDAVQVAYFSAFQHIDSFRGDACFKTWITRIVVNCCLMQLRERRRHVACVYLEDLQAGRGADILPSQAPTPEKSAWRGEVKSAISHAVSRLPKPQREVYNLSVSGLPVREIAATLGLTVPAAKTRLFRARAGMRLHLKPVWPDVRVDSPVSLRSRRSLAKRALSTV
jgi:RNA polymerase sigma-70 factor (ECF subfamily)